MLYCAHTDLQINHPKLSTPLFRHDLVERLWRASRKQSVRVVAWGMCGGELRLVVRGSDEAVKNVMRGVRVGTVRSARGCGVSLRSGSSDRWCVGEEQLESAVVWAHEGDRGPEADPLENVWTSHRDMMGVRYPVGWGRLLPCSPLQKERIHRTLGGGPTPTNNLAPLPVQAQLGQLLRAASSVLGVLPGDRRGFRLFVHLARASGWTTRSIASALCLTRRRVRQLASESESLCHIARHYLADERLRVRA